jgi:acetyl-CoA synthetase
MAVQPDLLPPAEGPELVWAAARARLDGLPGGRGLNMAYEAVDRHVAHGRGDVVALRPIDRDGRRGGDITYAELAERTSRFANVLEGLRVDRGDLVVGLLPRIAEAHVATLGTLKHGAVYCPLFAAFGPEPIRQRLELSRARVLVTTATIYERRLAGWIGEVDGLDHLLVLPDGGAPISAGCVDLAAALAAARPRCDVATTAEDDPALLHFTSGTTGTPKGAIHAHRAVVVQHATAGWALDLRAGDVLWCTADPGWVTGTVYGIVAPLTVGATCVVDEGDLDERRWYRQLESERVNVWYTTPTALRMLMRAGAELATEHDLSTLRFVASVGEPLDAAVVRWAQRVWHRPVHDNWWQTETGGIMIANRPDSPLRPGSMGRPVPGVEAVVLRRDPDDPDGGLRLDAAGHPQPCAPDEIGELALRAGWPSMFRGYLHRPDRYARCFVDGWYLSGDLVHRDAGGWFWFVGRGDDVIKSAGHLIGPFEVERVLLEHPSVAEAGVVGIPDPVVGEQVKAFVVPTDDVDPGDSVSLRRELRALARSRLGPVLAPRIIEFRSSLPHTRSGKVMRRLLRPERTDRAAPTAGVSSVPPSPLPAGAPSGVPAPPRPGSGGPGCRGGLRPAPGPRHEVMEET